MKTKIIFIGVSVFFYASFHISTASADIIISEFTIGKYIGGKATSTNGDDFIELYNTGSKCVPLEGWKLRKRIQSGTESSLREIEKGKAIMPNDFFLWISSGAKSEYRELADTTSSATLSGQSSIALFDSSGSIKDSVIFGGGHINPFSSSATLLNPGDGLSNERNLSTLEWKDISVTPNPTNSTPSTGNDLDDDGCPDPPPTTYDTDVRLNEILANPSGDEGENEFIELYNTSDKTIDFSSWIIKDASASGKYVFPDNTKIKSKEFLVVYRTAFIFALNNSDETISLLDPNGEEKDKVSYKTTKESISWNYAPSGWRGGTPTPGIANQLNNLPETKEKVPKKGYHGVEIDFDAQGEDSDHDTLKYTWDFGDDHKSYQEKTTHTYEENGTYTVTLKTTDGKEDTEETFTLKIESFPHPEVRITSLLANPSGSDTGNEWIVIENREKKTINLKDYSVATGWKTLSNHPIREDFLIKPKSEAKLIHDYSLFTLPNQKGKIELRAPDGKVLQNIKYKLDKPIAENVVYRKEKGSAWKWQVAAKQTPAAPEKEIRGEENIPPIPETKPEEVTPPKEEDVLIETSETKSDQFSLNPDRPLPQNILAYGTHVRIPNSLIFSLLPNKNAVFISKSDYPNASLAEALFSRLNASLNGLLNSPREE